MSERYKFLDPNAAEQFTEFSLRETFFLAQEHASSGEKTEKLFVSMKELSTHQ